MDDLLFCGIAGLLPPLLRILHISTRLILGGSQENTVLSCEGQARLGHEVHLAFGPIYGPEGSLLERVQEFNRRCASGAEPARPITTHVVPHLVRAVNPWADWRCSAELRRLIRELKPDIVHTHSSKAGILGRAAAWSVLHAARGTQHAGPAIVHTIHGPPFMPLEGGPLKRARTRIKNLIYTLAERSAARRCHTIISVADAMTREFLRRGIGRPDQYVTVASGMEVELFLSAPTGEDRASVRSGLGLAPGDFVVGTVARLAEHKGHDDLLDALSDDLRAHPHWRLLWVGDGWWRQRLLARARALGLAVVELDRSAENDRDAKGRSDGLKENPPPSAAPPLSAQILLTGLVPPHRVPGLVRAMDVLAHPSYREGLPRTVPQALLCAVCPVAYDVDGTGEVCRDMQTGRLVPAADRAALGDAVRWLAGHTREREAMALRGRDECRERFSARTMVQALEQVYKAAQQRAG